MLDRVGEENVSDKELISKHFPKLTLEAPGYTPWYVQGTVYSSPFQENSLAQIENSLWFSETFGHSKKYLHFVFWPPTPYSKAYTL